MKRVTEPVRKSLLDVVRKNLRAVGKTSHITRAVYIGKYSGANLILEKRMETAIQNSQANSTVLITGLFLIYPQYYVHVIESSEKNLYNHLKLFHEGKDENFELGRSIFLPSSHHVHQRFFAEWYHVYTIPPSLLDIPETYELEDIRRQMSNCLTKVYILCDDLANTIRDYSIPMNDVVENLGEKLSQILPESTMIEYLLNVKSPGLLSVEEYLKTHMTVPLINLYQDTIWPPPHDFMFGDGCEKDVQLTVNSSKSKR